MLNENRRNSCKVKFKAILESTIIQKSFSPVASRPRTQYINIELDMSNKDSFFKDTKKKHNIQGLGYIKIKLDINDSHKHCPKRC